MFFSQDNSNIYSSNDHKVTTPSEKTRIEQAGGYGGLAVARAFGDFHYKKIAEDDENPDSVSVVPEVKVFDEKDVGGILIMCDGVTDVLEDEDIFEVYKNRSDDANLSEVLVMQAFEK